MLVIDESMLKLSRMQETLLKVSDDSNRQINLDNYVKTVKEIDKHAFSGLFDEVKQIDEHNRTLEEELQFLEQVKGYYDQLYEMQLGFKNVCDTYGKYDLKLSDMSQIDIEYIDSRISTINGYLINKKNIVDNKRKLQKLNDELVIEEKNSKVLSERLSGFERELINNFLNAEGRLVVDGKLQYISIVSEYKELGYEFESLLNDELLINEYLTKINSEKIDIEEKVKVAEICFDRSPNVDSKQIYNEINKEYLRIKYRLTMVKILQLLNKKCNSYDLFREKREKLLDLIKYRQGCLVKLGVHISIDPFNRTRVSEQFDMISSLKDNNKILNKIKKSIAELNLRIEEMESQDDRYMLEIQNTKNIVIDRLSMSDIDVSSVVFDVNDFIDEKVVADNQVVEVKNISDNFDMKIINQKTNGVIKRVNEMMNVVSEPVVNLEEVVVPDLVIIPDMNTNIDVRNDSDSVLEDEVGFVLPFTEITDVVMDENKEIDGEKATTIIEKNMESELVPENEVSQLSNSFDNLFEDMWVIPPLVDDVENENHYVQDDIKVNSDLHSSLIFETVKPFEDVPLFSERADEHKENVNIFKDNEELFFNGLENGSLSNIDVVEEVPSVDVLATDVDEMPDAFWVTQEENKVDDETVISFDEQINALLASEEDSKVKKLVA